MWTALAVLSNSEGPPMSAMLGSSRRDARARLRLESGEIMLVERGAFRYRVARLLVRLEKRFSPPELRR
jgi:hypothetical protein